MATLEELLGELRARDIGLRLEDGGNLRVSAPREALTAPLRAAIEARKPEIVAHLAAAGTASGFPELTRLPRGGRLPLSFAQERFWFLHQLDPAGSTHNVSISLTLGGAVELDILRRSLVEQRWSWRPATRRPTAARSRASSRPASPP